MTSSSRSSRPPPPAYGPLYQDKLAAVAEQLFYDETYRAPQLERQKAMYQIVLGVHKQCKDDTDPLEFYNHFCADLHGRLETEWPRMTNADTFLSFVNKQLFASFLVWHPKPRRLVDYLCSDPVRKLPKKDEAGAKRSKPPKPVCEDYLAEGFAKAATVMFDQVPLTERKQHLVRFDNEYSMVESAAEAHKTEIAKDFIDRFKEDLKARLEQRFPGGWSTATKEACGAWMMKRIFYCFMLTHKSGLDILRHFKHSCRTTTTPKRQAPSKKKKKSSKREEEEGKKKEGKKKKKKRKIETDSESSGSEEEEEEGDEEYKAEEEGRMEVVSNSEEESESEEEEEDD